MGSQRSMWLDPAAALLYPDLIYSKANILINKKCQACLADFTGHSLSTALSDQTSASTASQNRFSRIQWMSPELIDPDRFDLVGSYPTEESDCYALGMVIYEVLTGGTPFHSLREFTILHKVLEGERPVRPEGFPDSIWEMLKCCWETQPNKRPKLDTILHCLQDAAQQWIPPHISLALDEDVWTVMHASVSSSGMFSLSCPRFQAHPQSSSLYDRFVSCSPPNNNGLWYISLLHPHPLTCF